MAFDYEEEYVETISDPIYDIIRIPAYLKILLETPQMQRLKNIRQMGLAYLDYPGATHTRFEHSVGVVQAIRILTEPMLKKFAEELAQERYCERVLGMDINDEEARRHICREYIYKRLLKHLEIAALLHDLGHPPFSHTIERAFHYAGVSNISHEDYTVKRIAEIGLELLKMIRDVLERHLVGIELGGEEDRQCLRNIENLEERITNINPQNTNGLNGLLNEITETLNKLAEILRDIREYPEQRYDLRMRIKALSEFYDVNFYYIAKLVKGEDDIMPPNDEEIPFTEKLKLLAKFISDSFDADKLDYTFRDCYHAGLHVGIDRAFSSEIEINRRTNNNNRNNNDADRNNNIKIIVNKHGLHFINDLLYTRYKLQTIIHDAPNNRIANFVLMNIIAYLYDYYQREIIIKLSEITDSEFLDFISRRICNNDDETPNEQRIDLIRWFYIFRKIINPIKNPMTDLNCMPNNENLVCEIKQILEHNVSCFYMREIVRSINSQEYLRYLRILNEIINDLIGLRDCFVDLFTTKRPELEIILKLDGRELNLESIPLISGLIKQYEYYAKIYIYKMRCGGDE